MNWRYLKYLARHKWFVFCAGSRMNVPMWRLIIHDWSKLLPCEWRPYAKSFYGPQPRTDETKRAFDAAWLHHQHFNPHHWQHWVLREDNGKTKLLQMPENFAREMVADWCGAGRAITGKWEVWIWYAKNAEQIQMHEDTRKLVQSLIWVEQGELAMTEPGLGSGALREALERELHAALEKYHHFVAIPSAHVTYFEARDMLAGILAKEMTQRLALSPSSPIEPAHEPQLYALQGPVERGVNNSYTIASLGCSCGWNSDGKAGETQKWSEHIGTQASSEIREARLQELDGIEKHLTQHPYGASVRQWIKERRDALAPSRQGAAKRVEG